MMITWMVRFYEQGAVHVMVAARLPHQKLAQTIETFSDVAPLVEQCLSANVQLTSARTLLDDAQWFASTVHLGCHDNRLPADAEVP